jgi:tryptophan-rich sensory protein
MNETYSDALAHDYYLPYQLIASLLWAVLFILAGLALAWLIWGQCRRHLEAIKARNLRLQAEVDQLKS